MPLQHASMQLLAVATPCASGLFHCHQCNSDLFVAFALLYISAQCRRVAVHFSTLPLLNVAVPPVALAKQLIAFPLPCVTLQCFAFALQFRALHIFATALHIDAVRCHCFAILRFSSAMLCVSSPCLRGSTQVTSLPRNTAARLRILHYAAVFLCSANHCAAIAMQRYTLAAHASV